MPPRHAPMYPPHGALGVPPWYYPILNVYDTRHTIFHFPTVHDFHEVEAGITDGPYITMSRYVLL